MLALLRPLWKNSCGAHAWTLKYHSIKFDTWSNTWSKTSNVTGLHNMILPGMTPPPVGTYVLLCRKSNCTIRAYVWCNLLCARLCSCCVDDTKNIELNHGKVALQMKLKFTSWKQTNKNTDGTIPTGGQALTGGIRGYEERRQAQLIIGGVIRWATGKVNLWGVGHYPRSPAPPPGCAHGCESIQPFYISIEY